ncbi:GGDEF domain-containing protein [Amycolatopsis sp. WGS_07]|uniref:sensor domain-containing diguanylate cyclase n=1 Tax=Amycolatopsis sp. WGS_07 TaxID=3076764 RepID=UPI00387375DD
MADTDIADRATRSFRTAISLAQWNLWTQRPSLIAYCLLIETVAVVTTAITAFTEHVSGWDLLVFGLLSGFGLLQAELGREVERLRLMSGSPHINLTSVWSFAGVLVLPSALVTGLVAILYLYLAVRRPYRLRRGAPFRVVFNAALVVVTCQATAAVLSRTPAPDLAAALHAGWVGSGCLALATVAYFVIAALITIPGLSAPDRSPRTLFGGWGDNLLEVATLCLGILTALAVTTMIELALCILPPLLVIHRAVLVKQLEIAATTDEKTGLFNTTGWHALAAHELDRAQRTDDAGFGVLMVDLDRFKRINDEYGHLSGDAVLRAVAAAITGAVRDYGSVGRFGGEEFVVLVPDAHQAEVRVVAERVRAAVARLTVEVPAASGRKTIDGLSASIGLATYPESGSAIDSLVHAADQALYRAKDTGRNKVVSIADLG